MGKQIYFTNEELKQIRSICFDSVENEIIDEEMQEKLNKGLGSAMKKLFKGTKAEKLYLQY